ncbi:hypothetical protein [Streptomyces sp. NPDC013489]|uniref:hypothetical protein n=1 Tax=Streptomyces sp. NPDC013489 TaxID=3155606 RepID=UPI0033F8E1B2
MSKRILAGKKYDYLVTVQVGSMTQDFWGYTVGSGRTEDEELAEIRIICGAKLNVPSKAVQIVNAVFTLQ